MAPEVLEPTDAASLAAKLKWANAQGLAVAVRGAGTKQAWGAPASRTDVVLSTLGLNSGVDHVAGDLVATVPAGATLVAVNDVLRREKQWLPLDPGVSPLATIGGVIATNDSGPRRHRYGTPRDLIIGIEIALADGRTAKAGGRVVKNVAGYDLSKLLCGSLGSLGVITSATFKLAPVAPVSCTVAATVGDLRRLGDLALAIAGAPLMPSTIEIQSPPHRLAHPLRNGAARGRRAEPCGGRCVRRARGHDRVALRAGGNRRVARARPARLAEAGRDCEAGDAANRRRRDADPYRTPVDGPRRGT